MTVVLPKRCDTALDGEPYGPAQERVDALLADSVDSPTAARGSGFERAPGAERVAQREERVAGETVRIWEPSAMLRTVERFTSNRLGQIVKS